MNIIDKSKNIIKQIDEIEQNFIEGEIRLLDLELFPFFEEIEQTIRATNLENYSKSYKKACGLLNEKFKELKELISSFESEKRFVDFLHQDPTDQEIAQLFQGCWRKPFTITQLSTDFLEKCKQKLTSKKQSKKKVLETQDVECSDEFRLEIPKEKFSEKMMNFFETIKPKLPCSYREIFQEEKDQIEIYEKFIYLLHLLQIGKIKYQKKTNFLYT
ncbi:MAG: hypothetical protein ACOC44_18340 [Promethearchaeia archaeon]